LLNIFDKIQDDSLSIHIIDGPAQTYKTLVDKLQNSTCIADIEEVGSLLAGLIKAVPDNEEVIACSRTRTTILLITDFKDFSIKASIEQKADLERLIRKSEQFGIRIVIAGLATDLAACWDGPVKAIRDHCAGLVLTEPNDQQLINIRLPYTITSKPLKQDEGYFSSVYGTCKIKLPTSVKPK
ncbi:MAG: hypothetical protein SCM11_10745, partial [Bacillota bacterium]|nr:hypothetical protein [Bacillota bacterium]